MARRGFAVLFDVCLFRLGGGLSFVRGEEEAHVTPGDADAVMALGFCRFHFRPPYPVPGKLREPISALGRGTELAPPGQGVGYALGLLMRRPARCEAAPIDPAHHPGDRRTR